MTLHRPNLRPHLPGRLFPCHIKYDINHTINQIRELNIICIISWIVCKQDEIVFCIRTGHGNLTKIWISTPTQETEQRPDPTTQMTKMTQTTKRLRTRYTRHRTLYKTKNTTIRRSRSEAKPTAYVWKQNTRYLETQMTIEKLQLWKPWYFQRSS